MKIEGRNAVSEAVKAGTEIDKVYIEKGAEQSGSGGSLFRTIRSKGIKFQFLPRPIMEKESLTGKHQGFIAVTADFVYSEFSEVKALASSRNEPLFIVVLDGVSDPHNLGSVLRVCECAGVHGVVIPKHRAASVNETVVRVSAGASEHIPVVRVGNINAFLEECKADGIFVYGAEADGTPMYQANLSGDIALVIGSEGEGIHALTRKTCDEIVSIPMFGEVNSLNASVACGVVVYEAVRQRNNRS
ncbi:MAG: 23S rRNA (guanosine(2251)-2'-O)-methyltransferase RlmB [Clostridia bacterium]|nr:23S rRNA (guanosine(2251)-2'-O)-methyltransferase RlmB [Clostridia bacterium]